MERNGRPSAQRRMSFNYKWDVQEQSASISFSSFGVTLTKRPLDLLDESFERSDQSAPVSLIQLSQGQVFARRSTPPDSRKANFSIGEWFCPKLSRGPSLKQQEQPAQDSGPLEFLPATYVDSSTVRLTDNGRFDPHLLEECADQDFWQRRRFRRPLPGLPLRPSADRDDEEQYFHSGHLSLVILHKIYISVFFYI